MIGDELNLIETFIIKGEFFKDAEAIPITLQCNYPEYDNRPVTCSILLDYEGSLAHLAVAHSAGRTIYQFRGLDYSGREIWIPRLRIDGGLHGSQASALNGTAEIFIRSIVGDLRLTDKSIGFMTCLLTLPYTGLAVLNTDYDVYYKDRTIKYGVHRSTSIEWETGIGKSEIVRIEHGGKTIKLGADIARIEIDSVVIKLEVNVGDYFSLQDFLSQLWKSQETACWLLSFLSKKRIFWYHGDVYENLDNQENLSRMIEIRRETFYTEFDHQSNQHAAFMLVKPETLANGTFSNMYDVYSKLNPDLQKTLLRAIQMVQITYDDAYYEMTQSIIYACFEMLINALANDQTNFIMEEGVFNKFSDKVKKHIKNDLLPAKEHKSLRASIYNKLGELRRRAFHEKVENVLSSNGISISLSDLWHPETPDFKVALREMIDRRNALFHEGVIRDYALSGQDFYRLRYIISILILKILEYPTELITDLDSISQDKSYAQSKRETLPQG